MILNRLPHLFTCKNDTVQEKLVLLRLGMAVSVLFLMGTTLLWGLHGVASAQSDGGRLTRHAQIGGTVNALAVGPNNVLYIGDGVGLIAANVAGDLTISSQTRQIFPGLVSNLVVSGSVGYLAMENRFELYVLDLSVPLTPTIATVVHFDNAIVRLRHFDNRLYVVFRQSIAILDISLPSMPDQLGAFDLSSKADEWFIYDLAVAGEYAYLGGVFSNGPSTAPSGFIVLNIANPLSPSFVITKTITDFGGFGGQSLLPGHLALHGTDLFATANIMGLHSGGSNTLRILDVTSLSAFEQSNGRAFTSLGGTLLGSPTIESFVVQGSYGYVLSRNGELRIIDLESSSNPPDMTVIETVPINPNQPLLQVSIARSLALADGSAFVGTDEDGVVPLEISSPLSPTIRPTLPLLGIVQGVSAQPSGETMNLVLTRPSALSRVHMASPPELAFTGKIDLYEPHALHISGNRAYFAANAVYGEESHLQVMDPEASPENLLIGEVPIGPISALSTSGRWIYAADIAREETDVAEYLQVLDAEAGALPAVVASYPLNDVSVFLQVQGSFLYRITQGGNFEVFSLSNPVAPALEGTVDLDIDRGFIHTAVVEGLAAYVLRWSSPLVDVLDLRNPQSPTRVDEIELSALPSALTADETTLYIAADRTLYSFTRVQPFAPTLLFSTTVAAPIQAVKTLGAFVFVAEGDAGLSVYSETNYSLLIPLLQASQ